MNSIHKKYDECPACQRGFLFVTSGGPCSVCHCCCDCCVCADDIESILADRTVECLLADSSLRDSRFRKSLKGLDTSLIDTEQFRRKMVKIAIWPYTMTDDEISFDPETGRLTDEAAQKVEHYLSLNLRKIPPTRNTSAIPKQVDCE
jgi:hypothetical protein